jgi:hypothetical protein
MRVQVVLPVGTTTRDVEAERNLGRNSRETVKSAVLKDTRQKTAPP